MNLFNSRYAGIGSYLPPKVLSNQDLENMVDTTDEWITERTGILERRISETESTSEMAYKATLIALEKAQITIDQIDLILFATVSGDKIMPSAACYLQEKLGCTGTPAIDLSAACSGFLYASVVADQFIQTGKYKNILVVGAERLSRYVDYQDRSTCILFGDGAGAAIVQRSQGEERFIDSEMRSDGHLASLLDIPAGGTSLPLSKEVMDERLCFIKMQGREVFKNAVRAMADASKQILQRQNMSVDDIDWFIPHQANLRIIEAVAKNLNIPKEKLIINIQKTGNTSSASIPLAFYKALEEEKIQRGHKILMMVFGAGLTSGSLLLTY